MLSSRNKPSGSFLPTAYHWPAYYQRYKVYQNSIQQHVLHHSHPHHSSTYPWFVKVLHDRYVGHLAVLSPGHCQEAEGHKVAQHSTSQKKSTWKEVSLLYYHFNISFRIRHILMKQQLTQYWSIQKKGIWKWLTCLFSNRGELFTEILQCSLPLLTFYTLPSCCIRTSGNLDLPSSSHC